jgi:hypothetical protein
MHVPLHQNACIHVFTILKNPKHERMELPSGEQMDMDG